MPIDTVLIVCMQAPLLDSSSRKLRLTMKSAFALLCVLVPMHYAAAAVDDQSYEPCQKMGYKQDCHGRGQKQDNVSSEIEQKYGVTKQIDQASKSMEHIQQEKGEATAFSRTCSTVLVFFSRLFCICTGMYVFPTLVSFNSPSARVHGSAFEKLKIVV